MAVSAIIVEVYDALKEAGASEEKSKAAAKAIADYDSPFAKIEADLLVLKWMTGAIVAGVLALVSKTFF
jgi:hypothetical protein